jgi:Ca-activated chloride channel family protein
MLGAAAAGDYSGSAAMTFDHPGRFLLLYALIPIILLMLINYKRRFSRIYSLVSPTVFYDDIGADTADGSQLSVRAELRLRYMDASLFFIIFFACMVFALAGPRYGIRFVREIRRGADVVLAFDLSRSMDVKDASPLPASEAAEAARGLSSSRLERSVWTAKAFVQNLLAGSNAADIRFGAALGKGGAVLAVPLTGDTEALFALLDSLSTVAMTSRGTNLEKLVDTAASAFQDSFPSARYVALFSDGEALSGSIQAAASRLRQRDIKLLAACAGSVYGAAVPETGQDENTGNAPVSRPRPDVLSVAAERTGGLFVDGGEDTVATALAGYVISNGLPADAENAWTLREESAGKWHLATMAALAAFILSKLCSLSLRKRRRSG